MIELMLLGGMVERHLPIRFTLVGLCRDYGFLVDANSSGAVICSLNARRSYLLGTLGKLSRQKGIARHDPINLVPRDVEIGHRI